MIPANESEGVYFAALSRCNLSDRHGHGSPSCGSGSAPRAAFAGRREVKTDLASFR